MNKITSLTNDKVKYWCKLGKRKFRKEEGLFLVEGENLVKEALSLGIVKEIITTREVDYDGNVTLVTKEIMNKVSNLENASDIMALVEIKLNDEISNRVLILDEIQDPGNLGTIIRSAVAFNFSTIVLGDGCVDAYNDKTIRASEGMFFKVNIIEREIISLIDELKDKGYVVLGTDVNNGVLVDDFKNENNIALIIGNEGRGVSKEVLSKCDKNLYIKLNDKCESLNASVAASILMYELNKR